MGGICVGLGIEFSHPEPANSKPNKIAGCQGITPDHYGRKCGKTHSFSMAFWTF